MLKHTVIVMVTAMASTALTMKQSRIGNASVKKEHVGSSVDIVVLRTTSIHIKVGRKDRSQWIKMLHVKVS